MSNLNRQFLFREHNVGQAKSAAAAIAAKSMNADIKVSGGSMVCRGGLPIMPVCAGQQQALALIWCSTYIGTISSVSGFQLCQVISPALYGK